MVEKFEKSIQKISSKRANDEQAIKSLNKALVKLSKQDDKEPTVKKTKGATFVKSLDLEFSIAHNVEVENPAKTWRFDRKFIYIKPWSLKGTVNAIKHMEAAGVGLKGIGSRHSFSQVVRTDQAYLDLSDAHKYDKKNAKTHNATLKAIDQKAIKRLKKEVLKGGRKEYYFDVPGGMSIMELNQVLGPSKQKYKSFFEGKPKRLFNMGGGDVQAYAGAFSTGTHGTGGTYSAYHDTVRSILLVASGGKIYRIEPQDNAITDPIKHQKFYQNKAKEEQVELIQDNDHFYSTLVSMGCFGIIYSTIIEITDMTRLHEELIYLKGGWNPQEKAKIGVNSLPSDPQKEFFYSLQVNPYKIGKEKYPSTLSKIVVLTDKIPESRKERKRNFWPAFIPNLPLIPYLIKHTSNANSLPKRRLIETTLRSRNDHSRNKGKGHNDLAYNIWNAGTGKLETIGTGIEFAFPVDELVAVVDGIMKFMEQQGRRKDGFYMNSPMSIRFIRPSKAYLAPNYFKYKGKEVKLWAYLEILHVNGNSSKHYEKEQEFFKILQELLFKAGGRPHWGLSVNFKFNRTRLKQLYPKYQTWKVSFDQFNPTGTFDNDFIRESGIRLFA